MPGLVRAPVLSVVLHGSLASGDFLPGRSDLDLLAVVDGGLAPGEAAAIEALVRGADTGGASGVDLHVVTAAVAAAPTAAPGVELHVGRYGAEVEVTARAATDPDLPAELSIARAGGRALLGAAPRDVLGPVPAGWVRERGRYWLERWLSLTDDDPYAAHMVLTACRIWRFGVEGVHSGKLPAAAWALGREPSLEAIGQAVRRYRDDPAAPVDPAGIAAVLTAARREA